MRQRARRVLILATLIGLGVFVGGARAEGPYKLKMPLGLQEQAADIPADNPLTAEKVELGKQLYFDKRLSADGTVATCHAGFNFTDEGYHNIGVGMDKPTPDLGRYNVTKKEEDKGAFKTPTLRNISASGPYFHLRREKVRGSCR